MSDWNYWCGECGVHHAKRLHLPIWQVCDVASLGDKFDSFVTIRVTCPEDAAERWAERWAKRDDDGGDYNIVGQRSTPTVVVQDDVGTEEGDR